SGASDTAAEVLLITPPSPDQEMEPVKRRLVQLLTAIALTMLAGIAFAGAATDLVKAKQADLFKALKANDDKKVSSIFDEMLAYQEVVNGALGKDGTSKCTDAEQKVIGEDMKKLIQNAWKNNLKKTLDFDINYTGEEAAGDATIVKTIAKPQSGGDTIE